MHAEGLLRADGTDGWEERRVKEDLHVSHRTYDYRRSYARRYYELQRFITATHLSLSVADR